jgi:hypothetical protein
MSTAPSVEARQVGSALSLQVFLVMLCLAVPGLMLILHALPLPLFGKAYGLIFLLATLIGTAAFSVAFARDLGGPFSPLTAFLFICMGFPMSGVYLLSGHRAITFNFALGPENIANFSTAAVVCSVGVSSFLLGYLLIWRKAKKFSAVNLDERPKHLYLAIFVLTIIGGIGWLLFAQSSGGLSNLVNNIQLRTQLRSTDYYRAISQLLQVSSWAWYIYDRRATRKPIFWIHSIMVFGMLFVMGQRSTLILHLLCYEVLRSLRGGKYSFGIAGWLRFAAIGTFIMALLLGVLWWRGAANATRGKGLSVEALLQAADAGVQKDALSATLFGQSNLPSMEIMTMVVRTFPDQLPYLGGESYLWLLASPVPRSLWVDKPVNLGLYLNRAVEGPATATGRPPSLIGEFYMNFSWAGAAFGCLLAGMLCAHIARTYWGSSRSPFFSATFALFILYFVALWTKVELKQGIVRFTFYFAGLVLFATLASGRIPLLKRRARAAENSQPPEPHA